LHAAPEKSVGPIIKDGLKALTVWAVIAVVLVALFHYSGWIIAQLIGFIFLACFIALRAAGLLAWLLRLGSRGAPPPSRAPQGQPLGQGTAPRCTNCGGSGKVRCPRCQAGAQQGSCGTCVGSGAVPCPSCSGRGY
jgi:hypothetical protein